jgi:hypothetical protein
MKQVIWNSKMVDDAADKLLNGFILKRSENPFYENIIGLRKSGIIFKMSDNEIEEFIKCKLDIKYFSEKYCYIKGEKGEPIKIQLRDYQEEILDMFFNNRFNILMASRQTGKCFLYNTLITIYKNGDILDTTFGDFYYSIISEKRKLTLLEKIKIKLYNLIYSLENTYLFERKP